MLWTQPILVSHLLILQSVSLLVFWIVEVPAPSFQCFPYLLVQTYLKMLLLTLSWKLDIIANIDIRLSSFTDFGLAPAAVFANTNSILKNNAPYFKEYLLGNNCCTFLRKEFLKVRTCYSQVKHYILSIWRYLLITTPLLLCHPGINKQLYFNEIILTILSSSILEYYEQWYRSKKSCTFCSRQYTS